MAAGGCKPEFDGRASLVSDTRVLAIRGDAAEAAPSTLVSFEALVVGPDGRHKGAPVDWAFCTQPKPLSESDDVAPADCFQLKGQDLVTIGTGDATKSKLPKNGCRQFGPDVPEAKPGDPPGRPADPDLTGGYYQPVRLILPDGSGYVLALYEARLVCGLPGAPSDVLQTFKKGYKVNTNPTIASATVDGAMLPAAQDKPGPTIARGAKTTLSVAWPACMGDAACGGQEQYLYYDPSARALSTKGESFEIAWYATGGTFDADRTGADEGATVGHSENGFTAPNAAGTVLVWVVVRDSRGGSTWLETRVEVQ